MPTITFTYLLESSYTRQGENYSDEIYPLSMLDNEYELPRNTEPINFSIKKTHRF